MRRGHVREAGWSHLPALVPTLGEHFSVQGLVAEFVDLCPVSSLQGHMRRGCTTLGSGGLESQPAWKRNNFGWEQEEKQRL